MASSEDGSVAASQLPKFEATTITIKLKKLPRRQLTLFSLTACLNVLLWTSVIAIITSIYVVASDPEDSTNIATDILTISSSLASIGYVVTHTIFSLKQRIWKHQGRHPAILKRTSYVAVRIAVTLCTLWLLTAGWNMITVARRPACLPEGSTGESWETGSTCIVGRLGVSISFIALVASFTLFAMLAVLRRPFEAHVFKHGYRDPLNPHPTPVPSRRASPVRSISLFSEKFRSRISISTHRSRASNVSTTDIEALDIAATSPTIHAPSPIRAIGLGIFTSHAQPPPLPTAYAPSRSMSKETPPPFVQPTAIYQNLPPPPSMASLIAPSGFVPLSIPAQYSASAWRAVHPPLPSPLGREPTRSPPNIPRAASANFSYRSRYSRSSISLTRPQRLSSATPADSVAWSSRSDSTGPGDEGRGSPSSGSSSTQERTNASAIAYAILNGTPIPGTDAPQAQTQPKAGHMRRASAPAPSTIGRTVTAEQHQGRMAKGWKPELSDQKVIGSNNSNLSRTPFRSRMPRSSSAELLSKFSPDSSPEDNTISLRNELERELEGRLSLVKRESLRTSRSESPLKRYSDVSAGAAHSFAPDIRMSRMPQAPRMPKRNSEGRLGVGVGGCAAFEGEEGKKEGKRKRWTFDELKNKPLPKIAGTLKSPF